MENHINSFNLFTLILSHLLDNYKTGTVYINFVEQYFLNSQFQHQKKFVLVFFLMNLLKLFIYSLKAVHRIILSSSNTDNSIHVRLFTDL